MTVRELIHQLLKMPQHATVELVPSEFSPRFSYPVGAVQQKSGLVEIISDTVHDMENNNGGEDTLTDDVAIG